MKKKSEGSTGALDIESDFKFIEYNEKEHQSISLLATSMIEHDKEVMEVIRKYEYLEGTPDSEMLITMFADTLRIVPSSLWVSLSFLSTNLLTGLGFFILNRKKEFRLQAALGIYLTVRAQMYFSTILGISLKMTMAVSQCIGQGQSSRAIPKFFTQSLMVWIMHLFLIYIPFIFLSKYIFPLIGFSTELASDYFKVAILNLPNDIIFAAHILLMEFCYAHNVAGIFTIVSWTLLPVAVCVCLVLSELANLGFESWVIGRSVFFILSLISTIWIYMKNIIYIWNVK